MPPKKTILTVAEACGHLYVSRATLYRLVSAGDVKSFKIRSKRLFRRDDLDAFLGDLQAA